MLKVRTTVGDIAPTEARCALTHEHLLWSQCSVPHLDRFVQRAAPRIDRDMAALADAGCNLLVDVSPIGFLRSGYLYRRIAERTGVRVVASTGTYVGRAIPPDFARLNTAAMTRVMVREIENGIEGEGVRAGLIKLGSAHRELAGTELRVYRAAVAAHNRTGAPITCHSYPGLYSQMEFFKAHRVDPNKVALGHVEANGWLEVLAAARSGLMLCYTNFGSDYVVPDSVIIAHVAELVRRGHERQIMLSTDFFYRVRDGRVRMRWPRYRYDHIFREIVPRLRALGVSEQALHRITDENPRRFLSF